MGYRRIGYASSTSLIVLAISPFVKGFMAKALIPAALAVFSSTSMTKACAENDGHVGPEGYNLLRKIDPGNVRHCLVRDDKIEAVGVLFQECQGLLAVRPGCYVVAELCEEFFTHLREGLFIIDKENAFGACREW